MAPTYGADRFQREIKLKTRSKGCHLVTNEIMAQIEEGVKNTKVGILHLFLQHTSAALSLNENASQYTKLKQPENSRNYRN
ncbi:BZ3500_MvSof-1268-A1-R1_Chr3-1g05750 [Microbotryum saponariae]|uniref:BZ3500_MvSof-1268-A1-R1_Chr3-1g05750 protein n=1 Tax=Microbotryum saponariae TaxID=289078 RepID=A0A2X0LIC5_9BASI|nr:BZ3500_MvSof-1268-A1-R1_Chr3-1g05750 [Microbotryum saponariae]SDA04940.1 BZ3501_MvSof-1269-A2-R1_Chr3-1g05420 [Microbotryum saponariae]